MATAIRGKDWIFNAFWAASLSGNSSGARCFLNLPITFLFKDGYPSKTVMTDTSTGFIKRVALEEESVIDRVHNNEKGLRGESYKELRVLRKFLIDFSESNGYNKVQMQQEEPFICKVFYNDDQIEDLALSTLDVLLRNESWRLQVLIIQGYIPAMSSQVGFFSAENKVRSKLDSGVEGLDQFTRAIAKYAEKAYAISTDVLLTQQTKSKQPVTAKPVKLHITTMESKFVLDHRDKVIFLYTEYLLLEIENGRKEMEDYMAKEKNVREISAAKSVSNDLLSLLHHAQQRGISLEESFRHFDTQSNGFVDTDMLIDGMARLGIGVTFPVGESVLQNIAGVGSGFITILDFERFLNTKAADLDTFEKLKDTKVKVKTVSHENISTDDGKKPLVKKKKVSKREATLNQLLPPLKDIRKLNDYMDIEASQMHQWENLPDQPDKSNDKFLKNITSMELPLPESFYSTLKSTDAEKEKSNLPKWANKRSHRALNELRRTTQQHNKSVSSKITDSKKSMIGDNLYPDNNNSVDSDNKVSIDSKKTKVPIYPLSLKNIANDLHLKSNDDSKDQLLHVDHGVIMTYRILKGEGDAHDNNKTHEKVDSLRYRSILELREKKLGLNSNPDKCSAEDIVDEGGTEEAKIAGNANGGGTNRKGLEFTLIIVPDLFMTLDTLQSQFESLLKKFPFAKIILVGLPGLPNTTWPSNWVLNSDLHSRSIAKLVQHLIGKNELNSDHSIYEPLFFIGLGVHSQCLSRFISLYLSNFAELKYQTKGVCFINGLLRYNKAFKKICKDLRQSMVDADAYEVNELISSLHFFDEYFNLHGREPALDTYWSTRRDLRMDGGTGDEKAGLGYIGILEQLKAIVISPDDFDGANVLVSEIPIIVVQSTEDVFVDPKNAAMFLSDRLPPERNLVTNVADSLDPNAVYVSWLKAGHEVTQERSSFILGLISNLVQICGIKPVLTFEKFNEEAEKERQRKLAEEVQKEKDVDVLELARQRKQKLKEKEEIILESERQRLEESKLLEEEKDNDSEIDWLENNNQNSIIADDEVSELNSDLKSVVDLEVEELEQLAARKALVKRKLEEKKKRAILAVERKKREQKLLSQSSLQTYYEREQILLDLKNEAIERKKMHKEDERSQFAADYAREKEIEAITENLAKEKAALLTTFRREEAIKKVEEKMALQRSQRIEERRKRAAEVLKVIQGEDLVLSGMQDGGYDMPSDINNVQFVIDACNRLMRDLLECRQRLIESIKRQNSVQEKTEIFRKQVSSVEDEERRLRRAIRLIEINPSILGNDVSAENEVAGLKRSLASKEETLLELQTLSVQREQQLEAANRSTQILKVALKERDDLMATRIDDLNRVQGFLVDSIKRFKTEREVLVLSKDKIRMQEVMIQKRVIVVEKELLRIKGHKGVNIDTDVWMEGVMQRCITKDLKHHLKRELELCSEKVKTFHEEIEKVRVLQFDITEKVAKLKRDSDKISAVKNLFFKAFENFHASPISQMVTNVTGMQKEAEKTELRRQREKEKENFIASDEANAIVNMIRAKESDLRNKEERNFVAIDLVLHPEAYLHLSVVEAEQMQFDEDYHCFFSKADLLRIFNLPEQINLALPFLNTPDEIEAHRLLNKFMRGLDENKLKDKDKYGPEGRDAKFIQGEQNEDNSRISTLKNNSLIDTKDLQDAEVIHDILIKESLRDRIRSLTKDENMTEDEAKWLQLDKILSPHVFDVSELPNPYNPPQDKQSVAMTLKTQMNKSKTVKPRPGGKKMDESKLNNKDLPPDMKDGNIYENLRNQYNDGYDMFDEESWICPFTKESLLILRRKPLEQLSTEDEITCRRLLDKFYVDENESILGNNRLKTLSEISKKMSKIIRKCDDEATEELAHIAVQFGVESDQKAIENNIGKSSPKNVTPKQSAKIKNISRLWGSWNQVHPSSAGKESQADFFKISTFNPHRDHPASFAIHDVNDVESDLSDEESFSSLQSSTVTRRKELGMQALTSFSNQTVTSDHHNKHHHHHHHSKIYIAKSINDLSKQSARKLHGKTIMLTQPDSCTIFSIRDASLNSRQSRSHYFTLPTDKHVLDITVSIVFQGDFGGKGYRLGRIAVGLFRLPGESLTAAVPYPVGFAPYEMQSPNLPNSLGKVLIIHKPHQQPIHPGTFQIVVGAASNTKYSVEVSSKYALDALPIVEETITKAKGLQHRLPLCLAEMDSVQESTRLTERKLLICEKMITEAEAESDRCEKGIKSITRMLEQDDEDMLMVEDERRGYKRELSILEIEYSQWANNFDTRIKEKQDIKDGLTMMYKFQRDRIKEKEDLKLKLEEYRSDLPPCINILRNLTEAVHVASALNTTLLTESEDVGAAAAGDFGGIQVSTPAEDVRRRLRMGGFEQLILEEQQWCLMDQALNPNKYDWLREIEDKEDVERAIMNQKPKVRTYNPAVEAFRLNKVEIEHVLESPFSMLSRREVNIRKLLIKFHDDKDFMKKKMSAVASGFDPQLAEKTRSKHVRFYTKEEHEWSSLDRVLHPEVWKYYVNRDENFNDRKQKSANDDSVTKKSKKKKSIENDNESMSKLSQSQVTLTEDHEDDDENNSSSISKKKKGKDTPWVCTWNKDTLMRIWRTPRHFLKTDEERNALKLLLKYNGSYTSYHDVIAQSNKRKGHIVKEGSHIQFEKVGKLVSKDTDYRARQLLREVDRATFTTNEYMSSDVLHANDQMYPTKVLRMHLEEALDILLSEQILDRERAQKVNVGSDDDESEEENNAGGVVSSESENSDTDSNIRDKIRKRAAKRAKAKTKFKQETLEEEVLKTRKKVSRMKNKSGAALAEELLLQQLGDNGCLACRRKRCRWVPSVDVEVCTNRINVLDKELERVRLDKEAKVMESDVCLSAQQGGNTIFRRMDLLEELTMERTEIMRRLDLNNVDKELHDAYSCRKEYFECNHLHGFTILLWTSNARQALDGRQTRLIALSMAREVVDDILDWMLEGWYFGERESQYQVLGLVPSIKPQGKIKPGNDQLGSLGAVVAKMKDRAEARKNGIITDRARKGQLVEKAFEIEMKAQMSIKKLKVARDGNSHEHLLNETEQTLKFGIFMLTLMYFRAMTFVKREQRSWGGDDDEIGVKKKTKVMTDERMRMLDEESKAIARKKKVDIVLAKCKVGEQRRLERERAEKREKVLRLQAVIRRQKLEIGSILTLQKVYRGHLGRKAAKRWFLKRAEFAAMNALLNAAAICLQRYYRGYMARVLTVIKRTEMAQFIALMRVQEAQQDEEIYWQTHPWARYKRDRKEWWDKRKEKMKGKTLGESRLTKEEQAQLDGKPVDDSDSEGEEEVLEEEDEG